MRTKILCMSQQLSINNSNNIINIESSHCFNRRWNCISDNNKRKTKIQSLYERHVLPFICKKSWSCGRFKNLLTAMNASECVWMRLNAKYSARAQLKSSKRPTKKTTIQISFVGCMCKNPDRPMNERLERERERERSRISHLAWCLFTIQSIFLFRQLNLCTTFPILSFIFNNADYSTAHAKFMKL